MKLLHVSVTIERGGAENHLISLIELQIKNNYQISVIYFKGKPYWESHLKSLGVNVHKVSLLTSVFQIIKIVKNFKPEILHAHLQTCEIISRIVLFQFPKIKFIISKHNDDHSGFIPRFLEKGFYSSIARRASTVICISENVKRFCFNKLGIPKDKMVVIYYGIDTEIYSKNNFSPRDIIKLQTELGISESNFVVGVISRLHPQKSLETLIKAANIIIHKHHVDNIRFVLVGEGPLETELKALTKSLKLDNHIVFTGKRSDIPLLYQLFDVFALTSIYEGLGLVLLESMAAKVPIIGTRAGAIPEIVGDSGLIVEPIDYQGLANTFLNIYQDENLRKNLIEKGYNRVINQFPLEKMFVKTHNAYLNSF